MESFHPDRELLMRLQQSVQGHAHVGQPAHAPLTWCPGPLKIERSATQLDW